MDLEQFRRGAADKQRHAAGDPLGVTRQFLRACCSDADSLEEVHACMLRSVRVNPQRLERVVAAIDQLLVTPLPDGALAQLVAGDANWVLENPTDAGAREWLTNLATMARNALPS